MATKDEKDQAAADAKAETEAAESNKIGETKPGGDFIVNGKHVNSEGEEIKKGK